jgi:Carbohydrate family 9 binding domain-like
MTPRARLAHAASFLSRSSASVSVVRLRAVQPVLFVQAALAVLLVSPVPADPPALATSPSYEVARAASSAERLLAADESAWAAAATIAWGPATYATRFRALWNDDGLYLRYDVDDPSPWHTMTKRDEHLWEEEVVEIFLDADRSGHDYYELEISPANVVCDLRMIDASPWKGEYDWNLAGLETRARPTKSAAGRTTGWTASAFLPWQGLRALPSAARVATPPKPGDRWRFNVFRIERPGGKEAPERGAVQVAWSPTGEPSFHVPRAFRDLVFADAR